MLLLTNVPVVAGIAFAVNGGLPDAVITSDVAGAALSIVHDAIASQLLLQALTCCCWSNA